MADDEMRDVLACHEKYELGVGNDGPSMPSEEVYRDRKDFITEEFEEFRHAWQLGDLPGLVDALVDMTYVIKGTAVLMGISPSAWEDLWNEVHSKNMMKVKSERTDHHNGLTKPPGWSPPDIQGILDGYKARFLK